MKLVVYIDVYFLFNGIFDFCILLLLSRLQKRRRGFLRLLAGAAAGGLGATLILFFSTRFSSLCVFLQYGLLPGLMLFISFGFSNRKSFFEQLLAFYGTACLLGGTILAFCQGKRGGWTLLAAAAGIVFLGWLYFPKLQKRQKELQNEYEVALSFGEGWIYGRALLDTGNRLREPWSKRPVVLAEFSAVRAGLPKWLCECLEDFDWEQPGGAHTEGLQALRWIPYHAVGTKAGLLPGIEAAQMKIWTEKESITKEGILLGIVYEPLAARGEYQFILHEDIMC